MKLPRPRLTVRQTMAIVALVAVALGAGQAKQRRELRQRCIAFHAAMERFSTNEANNPSFEPWMCGTGSLGIPDLPSDPCHTLGPSVAGPTRAHYLEDAAFHARMRRHYESSWW